MLTQRQRENWEVRVDLVRRFQSMESDSVQRLKDETTLAVAEHLTECEATIAELKATIKRMAALPDAGRARKNS